MGPLGKIALGFAGLFGVMYFFSKGPGEALLVGDVALVPVSKLKPESVPPGPEAQALLAAIQQDTSTKDLSMGIRVASITNGALAGPAVGLFSKDGTAQISQQSPGTISAKTNEVVGILKRGKTPAGTGNTLESGTF